MFLKHRVRGAESSSRSPKKVWRGFDRHQTAPQPCGLEPAAAQRGKREQSRVPKQGAFPRLLCPRASSSNSRSSSASASASASARSSLGHLPPPVQGPSPSKQNNNERARDARSSRPFKHPSIQPTSLSCAAAPPSKLNPTQSTSYRLDSNASNSPELDRSIESEPWAYRARVLLRPGRALRPHGMNEACIQTRRHSSTHTHQSTPTHR